MENNIEMFDEYVAKVFGELYRSFPVPIGLDVCKLSGDEAVEGFDQFLADEEGLSMAFEVCFATIAWLEEAGYITSRDNTQQAYIDCVLTAKGLEVLKSVPDSLKSKLTLGEALVVALRTGSKGAAAEIGKAAVSIGVGLLPSFSS